jgi:hypothetical protein
MPLALAVRDLPLAVRAAVCPTTGLAAAALLHTAHQRPPGRPRLGIAAAALAAFLLLPLMFDAQRERVAATLACQWPCSTSLLILAWLFGRGPLAQPQPFRLFVLLMNIPALPAAPSDRRVVSLRSIPPTCCTAAALGAVHYALACCRLNGWLLRLLQCLLPYLFASTAMELPALAFTLLSGLPVAAPFNRPFLSASIRQTAAPGWPASLFAGHELPTCCWQTTTVCRACAFSVAYLTAQRKSLIPLDFSHTQGVLGAVEPGRQPALPNGGLRTSAIRLLKGPSRRSEAQGSAAGLSAAALGGCFCSFRPVRRHT